MDFKIVHKIFYCKKVRQLKLDPSDSRLTPADDGQFIFYLEQ